MKKITLLLVIMVFTIGFAYSDPTDDQIRQAANTLGVPFVDLKQFVQSYQPRNTPSGTIQVEAAKLIDDYKANAARADSTYKGKTLEITSTVLEIGTDRFDLAGSRNVYNSKIRVYYLETEANKVINLDIGQTVTIIGKYREGTSIFSVSVYIDDAYIVR